jgi:hypothetical protein
LVSEEPKAAWTDCALKSLKPFTALRGCATGHRTGRQRCLIVEGHVPVTLP